MLVLLAPVTFLATALSGAVGMGGGTLLVAAMATILDPARVIPLHGLVQLVSNSSRALLLLSSVVWTLFFAYLPGKIVGLLLARHLYVGDDLGWLRPGIAVFVLGYLLFDRLGPPRLELPRWAFALAGIGGGLLTILVGVSGPYLSAFFLRQELEKEQIVATKAAIQWTGHLAKVPIFVSVGFPYRGSLPLLWPLLLAAVVGTWTGTRLLRRLPTSWFQVAFRLVLLVLAIRLLWPG